MIIVLINIIWSCYLLFVNIIPIYYRKQMTCHQKLDGVGAHSVTMVESVLAVWTPVVAIITGVSSVQCRTVCRVYVPGAMDLAATEDIDDIS